MDELRLKYQVLKDWLIAHQPIMLAFSGGVDSGLLLAACREAGVDFITATVTTVFQSAQERQGAERMADGSRWKRIPLNVLAVPGISDNTPQRCYLCKKAMFERMIECSEGRNVVDGTNYDDLGDFRPGMRALRELGVLSPLVDMGWTRADVCRMANELGLEHSPATGCLATRIPIGERIETGKLRAVDATEQAMHALGFDQVRVRLQGDAARIEVPGGMLIRAAEMAGRIVDAARAAGFRHAALDLDTEAFGRMDEYNMQGHNTGR